MFFFHCWQLKTMQKWAKCGWICVVGVYSLRAIAGGIEKCLVRVRECVCECMRDWVCVWLSALGGVRCICVMWDAADHHYDNGRGICTTDISRMMRTPFTLALPPRSCGTTDGGAWLIHSFLRSRSLDARLIHQISNALLQIIYAIAHVIDTCDYLIRHGLELILHVLQKILYLIRNNGECGRDWGRALWCLDVVFVVVLCCW